MSNVFLAYQNRTDQATLTGGTWQASLPLANLKKRLLSQVARSTNATKAATQFTAQISQVKFIRTVSLCRHNLGTTAKVRVRLVNTSTTTTVYESGWQDAWPAIWNTVDLEWEFDNWWDGRPSADDIASYPSNHIVIAGNGAMANQIIVEIDDEDNTSGYVQIGRLFIGSGFQPGENMAYGASLSWESRTNVQEAESGAEWFDQKAAFRVARFELPILSEAEAMGGVFELQRIADIHGEVLFIFDPDDTQQKLRRSFVGRLRSLSPIEYPYFNNNASAFEIKELL